MTTETRTDADAHTPGPWEQHNLMVYECSCGHTLAHLGGCTDPEAEANARLMAAAPDLLEFARYAIERIETLRGMTGYTEGDGDLWAGPWSWTVVDAAREVIARATGEVTA